MAYKYRYFKIHDVGCVLQVSISSTAKEIFDYMDEYLENVRTVKGFDPSDDSFDDDEFMRWMVNGTKNTAITGTAGHGCMMRSFPFWKFRRLFVPPYVPYYYRVYSPKAGWGCCYTDNYGYDEWDDHWPDLFEEQGLRYTRIPNNLYIISNALSRLHRGKNPQKEISSF